MPTPLRATLLAFAAIALPAGAQQDFSRVEIQATKLTESVYMLVGSGGNIGVSIGADTVFLVDDQYAPLTPKIMAAVGALTPKPVKFVLNTHWHGDHTGGNENLGKAGVIILAQDNVRKRMATDQVIAFFDMKTKAEPGVALPVITFSAETTFHFNGDEIHAFHAPRAHTDGDTIVHFRKSDVIHMGDTYFNGLYPFIDASSGGTVDGVIAAADKALAIAGDATKIIPGHGPLSNKAELKAYRDMLATVTARIRKMVKEGRKVEEIATSGVTAEFDAAWGKGFLAPPMFARMMAMNIIQSGP